MSNVGQTEKKIQARLVALLRDRLHYDYLGNWIDRADNRNVEPEYVRSWLLKQGVPEALVSPRLA